VFLTATKSAPDEDERFAEVMTRLPARWVGATTSEEVLAFLKYHNIPPRADAGMRIAKINKARLRFFNPCEL